MDHIDKDEELVCPLCGGQVLWMPVSHIYVCEHCKQSYSEGNVVYLQKKCKATAEKSSAVGNAAKLREALDEILSYIESFHKYITPNKGKELTALFAVADTIRDKARAALAAPPRNCDKYTTGKQVEDACADERGCPGCFREDLSSPCVSCTVS